MVQKFRGHLLFLSPALVLALGTQSSYAQATQAASPMNQSADIAPRRIVLGSPSPNAPIGPMSIFYKGEPLPYSSAPLMGEAPIEAGDDWLKDVTIKMQNRSSKTLIAGRLQLAFPGVKVNPMIIARVSRGLMPEHQLYNAAGQKGPQPTGATSISIAPGEYLSFSLADDYEKIRSTLEKQSTLSQVKLLVVDYGAYYFEGDLRWMMNSFRKADPSKPGNYIVTDPRDFMNTPQVSNH